MLKVLLIRHGMTPGNKLSRYIGSTDEGLSEEGRKALEEKKTGIEGEGKPDHLFVSPMLRCRETASILYGEMEQRIVSDLKEFDFGIFENKNYKELSDSAEYQTWIDSFCEAQVPGGESMQSFKKRCGQGLEQVIHICFEETDHLDRISLVVHGGTIMSLMEMYADEKKSYYEWSIKNGEGYLVELDLNLWMRGEKVLHLLKKIQ